MRIIINEIEYENPIWLLENGKAELRLTEVTSFPEAVQKLNVASGGSIEQVDEEGEQIGLWYVANTESIRLNNEDNNQYVSVVYRLNSVPNDIKEALETSIDEGYDATIELAELIDELDTSLKRSQEAMTARDARLNNFESQINGFTARLDEFNMRLNMLTDRVARLENRMEGES